MTEKNTAIGSAIANADIEIQIFQDQFQGLKQSITNINTSLIPGQTILSIRELSVDDITTSILLMGGTLGIFSDLILQRGKDLLLLADQANQFICVSNDAFDRVVDTWNWLTSQDMGNSIIEKTNILKKAVINLKDTINNRGDLITDADLLITQSLLDDGMLNIQTIIDDTIGAISNISLIFKKTLDATNIFKNVLAVNTTVGIALAVTQRAWDTMIRMNQHNYKTTVTAQDPLTITSVSDKLSTNELYPISMIDREKQINSWMNKILLAPGAKAQMSIDGKIYKFINKKDADYIPDTLPSTFKTLTTPQIIDQYNRTLQVNIVPDILLSIFSKVALIQAVGPITHALLLDWFNVQVTPSFTIEDLIAESENPSFVTWHNRYLNSSVIQETIQNILTKKQILQMRNTLLEYNEVPTYPEDIKISNSTKYNFEEKELLSGTPVQISFQKYINAAIIQNKDSSQHLGNIEYLKNLYKNKLVPDAASGQFTLALYKMVDGKEVLDKVLEQFKYSYLLYKDDLKIHYMEGRVNKLDYFLINNNKMQINYTYYEDLPKDITYVQTSEHHVQLIENYNSYLVDFDFLPPSYDIVDMTIDVVGVIEDKINGIKKDLKTNYKNSVDGKAAVITQIKEEIDSETHFVTDNVNERITVDITNIYRTELLKGKMDFTQARVNSIISTLRYLGYREALDAYIDDTWLYGVPRYVAQP